MGTSRRALRAGFPGNRKRLDIQASGREMQRASRVVPLAMRRLLPRPSM